MDAVGRKRLSPTAFCLLSLVLCIYGIISASCIPSSIESIAMPLGFMIMNSY